MGRLAALAAVAFGISVLEWYVARHLAWWQYASVSAVVTVFATLFRSQNRGAHR